MEYGRDGVLKCSIHSNLPMQILWTYRNGKRSQDIVKSDEKYTLFNNDRELKINPKDLSLEGSYSCQATLNDGYKSPVFTTDVKVTGIGKVFLMIHEFLMKFNSLISSNHKNQNNLVLKYLTRVTLLRKLVITRANTDSFSN